MTKRTPQEIADFFGCYVVKESDGWWYLFKNKPQKFNGSWVDVSEPLNMSHSMLCDEAIEDDYTRDYYEPHSGNQGKIEEDFPNHAKEVYTHKEYRIVSAVADTEDLDSKVTKLLNEGWKPIGGVAFSQYDDNHYDTFYQAMVRGV